MKRYVVFDVYEFYPGGGWNDFNSGFDLFEDAEKQAIDLVCQHGLCFEAQVVDLKDDVVYEYRIGTLPESGHVIEKSSSAKGIENTMNKFFPVERNLGRSEYEFRLKDLDA